MGYYTQYSLDWEPNKPEVEVYLDANRDTYYGIDSHGNPRDECKWYGHEKDMKALSKYFPDITFILSGEGEDQGDVWKKRFRNGEMEVRKARVVLDDFD